MESHWADPAVDIAAARAAAADRALAVPLWYVVLAAVVDMLVPAVIMSAVHSPWWGVGLWLALVAGLWGREVAYRRLTGLRHDRRNRFVGPGAPLAALVYAILAGVAVGAAVAEHHAATIVVALAALFVVCLAYEFYIQRAARARARPDR